MGLFLELFGSSTGDGQGSVERSFLPAALEIIETPPSPIGRGLVWIICAFTVLALVWAGTGSVDIVAVASGKIVTKSRTQIVQAPEVGVVKSIFVEPGQNVKAGDALIQLDTTDIVAEIVRARADLAQARLDELRLNAFLNLTSEDPFTDVAEIAPELVAHARAQLMAQRAERNAKLAAIDREAEQHQAEMATAQNQLTKAQDVLPLVEERADIRTKAAEIQFGNRIMSSEARQQVIETKAEQKIEQSHIDAAKSALAALQQQHVQTVEEFRKLAYADLSRAQSQASAARESLAKSTRRLELSTLRAPVDGSVEQLNVRTLGAVVSPAQQLTTIVPADAQLEIEAVLPSQDIGFVEKGQAVEIKVDAYPFTRYGLLKGKVMSVAGDSEPQPNPLEGPVNGTQRRADQAGNIEGSERLLYTVRISLESGTLHVNNQPAALSPGMSVRAEIKTGRRTILNFILSPLSEYASQSIRER